jgi:UDP-glucose 4-epimerase
LTSTPKDTKITLVRPGGVNVASLGAHPMGSDSIQTDLIRIMNIARSYRQMKVLITGAGGFIGSHLVERLASAGARLHLVSRSPAPSGLPGCWYQQDLTDFSGTEALLRRIDPELIIHLTSESRGGTELDNLLPTFRNDLTCAVNCLVAATKVGSRRTIITGSLEEPDERSRVQSSARVSLTPYAIAKHATRIYADLFRETYGLPLVTLILFMTYGPRQKPFKVVPYTILTSLAGGEPRLSSGKRLVDWIYIDDVIDCFVAAGTAPDVDGEIFEVGSSELISIASVANLITALIPGSKQALFGAEPDRGLDRVSNIAPAARCLGWQPRTPLRQGLEATIDWYREHRS